MHPAQPGGESKQRAGGQQEYRRGDPEAARGEAADQHHRTQGYDEFETEQRFLPATASPGKINSLRIGGQDQCEQP